MDGIFFEVPVTNCSSISTRLCFLNTSEKICLSLKSCKPSKPMKLLKCCVKFFCPPGVKAAMPGSTTLFDRQMELPMRSRSLGNMLPIDATFPLSFIGALHPDASKCIIPLLLVKMISPE